MVSSVQLINFYILTFSFKGELSKSLFKERTEKVTKRLGLVNNRYEALEKRRALEVEGYKTDIRILRERLRDLEKRLCKVGRRRRSSGCG